MRILYLYENVKEQGRKERGRGEGRKEGVVDT